MAPSWPETRRRGATAHERLAYNQHIRGKYALRLGRRWQLRQRRYMELVRLAALQVDWLEERLTPAHINALHTRYGDLWREGLATERERAWQGTGRTHAT